LGELRHSREADVGELAQRRIYAAVAENKGRLAFRVAVPEYYEASCLSCHGGPKGQIVITGYPREGRNEGNLGRVISITRYRYCEIAEVGAGSRKVRRCFKSSASGLGCCSCLASLFR